MKYVPLFMLPLSMLAGAGAVTGCTASKDAPPLPAEGDAGVAAQALADGQAATDGLDAGLSYPLIGAIFMQTPIMSEMDWPTREVEERRGHGKDEKGPRRIGYLRRGAKVAIFPEPHFKDNCKEGWYELVSGGFICAKYATTDMNHPKLRTAPHTPFLDQPLPYQYAFNIANGTPLYKTVPSFKDRKEYEPWLVHKPKPKQDDGSGDDDAGAASAIAAAAITGGTGGTGGDWMQNLGAALGEEDAGTPWYLRDWDGGKPQVTLDDLRGDDGTPIVRRMVKGFYLALDRDIEVKRVKWWKTTAGLLAPYNRMFLAKPPTDFHGVWLNTDAAPPYPPAVAQADGGVPPYWIDKPPTHMPVAFVSWPRSKKYTLSEDGKRMEAGDSLSRFTPLQLTGNEKNVGGVVYHEVEGGYWMRDVNLVIPKPGPAPADLKPGEKWIDVNLDNQSLVAFEGDKVVYATMVSTGREDNHDKEKDHRTPPGTFRIREKHIAATMDGDVASDGPYSIEDVPWIMYFNMSYALHGAFWHSNFGHEQSHGCVNLSPDDARALFGWTEPRLPDGWHAVWATPEHLGTRVVVHTDKPKPTWDN